MLPNLPLTLKLQNGAITYFINLPSSATINQLATKLSEVINLSGGFTKNLKPVSIEQGSDDIDIPKPSFDVNSSDEEIEEDLANTTADTEIGGSDGIQIDSQSLKFALSKTKKMDLDNLVLITDEAATLKSLQINDYDLILFAMKEDEFNIIEPEADRDVE